MRKIRLIGLACLLILLTVPQATALPPGGVVRGGIRGAMVGGMIGGRRGAGPPALMGQESKFLKTLEIVKSFRVEPTGLLSLLNDSGDTVLRFSTVEAPENE